MKNDFAIDCKEESPTAQTVPPPKPAYVLSLRDPNVRKAYDDWKAAHGIPLWFPTSDAERMRFETEYIEQQKRTLCRS